MSQASTSSFTDDTVSIGSVVNSGTNDSEASSAARTTLETALSDSGNSIVARVVTLTGTYLKVKWFRNGKVFGTFKSRNYTQNKAITSLEYLKQNSPSYTAISAPASLAVTGTNTVTGTASSQFTATITLADSSTQDITANATWTSATPAKATVSSTGLVTGVAAGTSVITATYAGVSNTRTMTVS